MSGRVKVRAARLTPYRPVSARRAVTEPVTRLVRVRSADRAGMILASGTGLLALVLAVIGVTVR